MKFKELKVILFQYNLVFLIEYGWSIKLSVDEQEFQDGVRGHARGSQTSLPSPANRHWSILGGWPKLPACVSKKSPEQDFCKVCFEVSLNYYYYYHSNFKHEISSRCGGRIVT